MGKSWPAKSRLMGHTHAGNPDDQQLRHQQGLILFKIDDSEWTLDLRPGTACPAQ